MLYHLRTGLRQLWGPEDSDAQPSMQVVLLATAGALSNVDRLSQAFTARAVSRVRFVGFLRCVGGVPPDQAEAFYQLRRGLLHSMKLSTVVTGKGGGSTTCIFSISDEPSSPLTAISHKAPDTVRRDVGFCALKRLLVGLIENLYRICLEQNSVPNNVVPFAMEKIRVSP